MTVHWNIGEAKDRFSELVAAAERGENIVIARAGKPVAKLVGLGEPGLDERERRAAKRVAAIGFAREEYAGYDLTLEDIKAERRYSSWRRQAHGLDP